MVFERMHDATPIQGLTRGRSSIRTMAGLVFLAGFLTFSATVGFDLVWDDIPLIQQVVSALSEGDADRLFTNSFHVQVQQSARYYRPVMMASLLFDVVVSGGAPWFSHLVNIFLHALNCVLALLLFRRILGNDMGAFAGALLFAIHPVHAEAVAVVSSRMDLLALLLLMPAALLYAVPGESRLKAKWPGRTMVLLSFFLACLTKETAFMFPFVLFSLLTLRGKSILKKGFISAAPVFFTAGGAFLIRLAVFAGESTAGGGSSLRAGAVLPDFSVLRTFKLLVINMGMAANPFPGRFHWFSGDLHFEWASILGAVLFLVLFLLVFWRNRGCAVYGIVWWSLFVLPVLGIFNLGQSLAAERYAYIPTVGVCLIAGGLVASMPSGVLSRRVSRGIAGGVAVILMITAAVHARTWKNEVVLFTRVVRTNPSYAGGYVNLGVVLAREGRHEEALAAYEKAEILDPGGTHAAFNRGNLLESLGKHEEALASFESVLEKQPGDWEASFNRGNIFAKMGKAAEAESSFKRALQNSGASGKPLVGLGILAARAGRYGEALELFTSAAEREPGLSEAYEGMGESWLFLERPGEAKRSLLKALEVSPGNTRAALMLGDLLMKEGRSSQALQVFRTALAGDPSSIRAWVGLIRASEGSGEETEVREKLREIKGKNPILYERVRQAVSGSPH